MLDANFKAKLTSNKITKPSQTNKIHLRHFKACYLTKHKIAQPKRGLN